ncbi:MAG: hypothetical protein PUJ51_18010 [Clostridiales bacterium]|nr:hypothetical protein [Clostridiales bacterium]
MMKVKNETHIEGILYEHALEAKVTGPNSKAPGTNFISGTISIATDDAMTNIVPVHFTYVTEKTSKGGVNATYSLLQNIIDGVVGTYMQDGPDKAAKLRVDSAIGLNEFYTDRNGKEELVSVKTNEGGFVHTTNVLAEKETDRNTFKCDMVITQVTHIDADDERKTPEKAIIKGVVFNFRNEILPVEFTATNAGAMAYFEDLGATASNPVFTKVWGRQVSEVIKREIREESAFGEDSVREVQSTRKDFVITGAAKEPYEWDSEDTILASELTAAIANRETYLATMKQRRDEYKASKGQATPAAVSSKTEFNF